VEGGVTREIVLDVLRQFGAFIVHLGQERYSLAKDGGEPEIHRLPDTLGRKLIGYLSRKFEVPVQLFWHPEQVADWKAAQKDSSKRADPN
jgi:hypothetical protein